MKTKALVIVSILAVGTALVYMLLPADPGGGQLGGLEAPLPAETGHLAANPAPEFETGRAGSAMSAEQVDDLIARGFVPREYRALWLDPDYQRIAEEQFNVIPKVAAADGESCVPLAFDSETICWNEYGYHPYLTYAIDDLRQMAGTDAAAAEALVFRLPEENLRERMHYALEASRLSGKSGPIMRFAYSFTPDASSENYFDQMLDRYAIAVAGESLGYPYRLSRELELRIRHEFDLGAEEFRDALRGRRVTMQEAWGDPS